MTTLSLTHNGTAYTAVPGTIIQTMLGFHGNHGTLATLAISLPEDDTFSTGDYILDKHRPGGGPSVGTAFGMDYILHILRAANTELWETLEGCSVLVLFKADSTERFRAYGLARTDGTHAFNFAELSAGWEDEQR